jgi:hypothetical protein
MLRHRDTTLDVYTKSRYHTRLQALCKGLSLPTAAEETRDRQDADDKYESATNRLRELRRDPKYRLLLKENTLYGFRRNLLGVKPMALVLVLFAFALTATIAVLGVAPTSRDFAGVFADAADRWPIYTAMMADLGYLLILMWLVRPHFVRQAADEYARALFRTLE